MRKVYFPNTQRADQSFWEDLWRQESLEDALRYCEIDYLRPIFLKHFPPVGRVLEAGCGLGQYVIYYQNQGYEIYGVDWASGPLRRIKQYQPHAGVLAGDVRQLPFRSKTFKVYYSGGVVEHFEGGPSQVLREAYRVLDDDGLLLITVPYLNIKRLLEDFIHFTLKRQPLRTTRQPVYGHKVAYKRQRATEKDNTLLEGYHFHEYCFTRREFTGFLERAGFRVIRGHGVGIQWGLIEFEWLSALYHRLRVDWRPRERSLNGDGKRQNPHVPTFLHQIGARRQLKEFIISESPRPVVIKPLLRLLQILFGHLILFICRKA